MAAMTISTRRDNLPADLTSLVGRRAESSAIKQLLSTSRLVTLTGTGGVGKTRLALHVARQSRDAFSGDVWLVSLAELTQPDLLPMTVMAALTKENRSGTGVAELIDYLGDRRVLLVLDNCEHMVDACATLVVALLRDCPNLRILATSRETLRVEGETPYPVPPLSVADQGFRPGSDDVKRYESAQLFLDRASAVYPGITLTPEDEQAVITLCRKLDGLPLAIELAAVQTRVLSIRDLLNRQDDRFRVLTAGSRTAPARHQTLRATMDYSYELCSTEARLLWARMAVFAGGATLEAVEAVCAGDDLSRDRVQQTMKELIDKSIVSFDGVRYQMLETLRAYGRELLRQLGIERSARQAHCDYFAALAADVGTGWFSPEQSSLLERTRVEHANLRAAFQHCLTEPGQVTTGLRTAGHLWHYWLGCGRQTEGRLWLDRLLAADTDHSPERVTALWVNGYLTLHDGNVVGGLDLLDECSALAGRLGDHASIAHTTYLRGLGELALGRIGDALLHLEEGVRLKRAIPDPSQLLPTALLDLGLALCECEQLDRAVTVLEEARDLGTAHGEQWVLSWSLLFLGLAALLDHKTGEAVALLGDGLARKRDLDDVLGLNWGVEFLAWATLTADPPDAERAARLMGASRTLCTPLGAHLAGFRHLLEWHEQRARQAREILGPRAWDTAFEQGRGMSKDNAIAYALGETTTPQHTTHRAGDEDMPLTRREQEIAKLVAAAKTNKEIAADLVIAVRTVDTHVANILNKLGLNSRTQVATFFTIRKNDS